MSVLLPLYVYPTAGAWQPLYSASVIFATMNLWIRITYTTLQSQSASGRGLYSHRQPLLRALRRLIARSILPQRDPEPAQLQQHPAARLRRDELCEQELERRGSGDCHVRELATSVERYKAEG